MFKKLLITSFIASTTMVFAMSISEVNTVSKEKLMEIKGIGDKKADAIIKQRKSGKLTSFDDLEKVSGIGKKMVANIKKDVKSKATKKSTTKATKDSTKKKTKSTSKTKSDAKKTTKK